MATVDLDKFRRWANDDGNGLREDQRDQVRSAILEIEALREIRVGALIMKTWMLSGAPFPRLVQGMQRLLEALRAYEAFVKRPPSTQEPSDAARSPGLSMGIDSAAPPAGAPICVPVPVGWNCPVCPIAPRTGLTLPTCGAGAKKAQVINVFGSVIITCAGTPSGHRTSIRSVAEFLELRKSALRCALQELRPNEGLQLDGMLVMRGDTSEIPVWQIDEGHGYGRPAELDAAVNQMVQFQDALFERSTPTDAKREP